MKTIRDLRNHFPKVKKAIEAEGEVIITDRGEPRYRMTLYNPAPPARIKRGKDYMARLRRYQPRAISAAAAKSLHEENRGDR